MIPPISNSFFKGIGVKVCNKTKTVAMEISSAIKAVGRHPLLSVDDKQNHPILDEPDFYEGPYRGSGTNVEAKLGCGAWWD